jgi:hypothetical protein
LTWSNWGAEGTVAGIEVPADALILLDGKLAERADAMKPGHLVKVLVDTGYFEFYSQTGQLDMSEPPADAGNACYALTLEDAVPTAPLLATAKLTVTPAKAPLLLHLDCRQDGIVGAAVITKRPGSRVKGSGFPGAEVLARGAYHEVEAKQVSVKDGKLTGEVTVRFFGGAKYRYNDREKEKRPVLPAEGPFGTATYTLDAAIVAEGAVSGTCRGSVEGTEVTGTLAGLARARPAVPADHSIWIRPFPRAGHAEMEVSRIAFIGFKVQGGAVQLGYISGGHSERLGEVTGGTATFANGAHTAEIQAVFLGGPATLTTTAKVIGGNLFGSFRLTDQAGAVCEGRLSGEALAFDCPSTEGWGESQHVRTVEKALRAQRDAKQGEKNHPASGPSSAGEGSPSTKETADER